MSAPPPDSAMERARSPASLAAAMYAKYVPRLPEKWLLIRRINILNRNERTTSGSVQESGEQQAVGPQWERHHVQRHVYDITDNGQADGRDQGRNDFPTTVCPVALSTMLYWLEWWIDKINIQRTENRRSYSLSYAGNCHDKADERGGKRGVELKKG